MSFRTAALAAALLLSACNPVGLLAGLSNSVAGPQIYESQMKAIEASYTSRGYSATRVQCVMTKLRAAVKPEDLVNITLDASGKPASAANPAKLSEAQKAAEAACPGT